MNLGFTSFMGTSFMISRYMDIEISGMQSEGRTGSMPRSIVFRSNSHRLKLSFGASMPAAIERLKYVKLKVS